MLTGRSSSSLIANTLATCASLWPITSITTGKFTSQKVRGMYGIGTMALGQIGSVDWVSSEEETDRETCSLVA
jgi:hypothetical protein